MNVQRKKRKRKASDESVNKELNTVAKKKEQASKQTKQVIGRE